MWIIYFQKKYIEHLLSYMMVVMTNKGPNKNLSIPRILKLPDWFQQQRRESQHLLGQAGILGTGTHPTIKNTSNDHKKGRN